MQIYLFNRSLMNHPPCKYPVLLKNLTCFTFLGAIVPVFKHRFRIIGCDLFVYRYMTANPEKFPQEVIDNVRNYHMREGNLKDDLKVPNSQG